MASTFEYPPALARHRPLYSRPNPGHPAFLRFQHHFFLTRLQLLALSVLRSNVTEAAIRRLNHEVVSSGLYIQCN
jgi:hypothetical protein